MYAVYGACRWSKIKSRLQEDSPVEEGLLLSRGIDRTPEQAIILHRAGERKYGESSYHGVNFRSQHHACMHILHDHASDRQLSKYYRRLQLAAAATMG